MLTCKDDAHVCEPAQVTDEPERPQTADRCQYQSAQHYILTLPSTVDLTALEAYHLLELLSYEQEVGDATPNLGGIQGQVHHELAYVSETEVGQVGIGLDVRRLVLKFAIDLEHHRVIVECTNQDYAKCSSHKTDLQTYHDQAWGLHQRRQRV